MPRNIMSNLQIIINIQILNPKRPQNASGSLQAGRPANNQTISLQYPINRRTLRSQITRMKSSRVNILRELTIPTYTQVPTNILIPINSYIPISRRIPIERACPINRQRTIDRDRLRHIRQVNSCLRDPIPLHRPKLIGYNLPVLPNPPDRSPSRLVQHNRIGVLIKLLRV